MKNSKLILISAKLFMLTVVSNAQQKSIVLTTGFEQKQITTTLAYQHIWRVGKQKKWGIGAGIRLSNNFGYLNYYRTAPAKLTTGKTGPSVFFGEDIVENLDSVYFRKTQVNALNATVNFTYNFSSKIVVGFNIDVIGFSFGKSQSGVYIPTTGVGLDTKAKPTSFNLLLISDNDLGTLNSEFFAQYNITKKWSTRLGFQFVFTEYTTNTKIQTTHDGQKNDRFRNKSGQFAIGGSYNF
jgi:hypothetical protein